MFHIGTLGKTGCVDEGKEPNVYKTYVCHASLTQVRAKKANRSG